MQIIVTKGLPGSGKSTWAFEYIEANPATVRVNKDEIRADLHGGVYNYFKEQKVVAERDARILEALGDGYDVVVDDTNLNPEHIERIHEIAREFTSETGEDVTVTVKDFTDVPLEECILRDSLRDEPVGERKIRDMHARYI